MELGEIATCQPLEPEIAPVVVAFSAQLTLWSVHPEALFSETTVVPDERNSVRLPELDVVVKDVVALTAPLKVNPNVPSPPMAFLTIVNRP